LVSFDKLGAQIWDAFPFSVVVTDYVADPKQRKIVYVNPAFTQLTGFAALEAVGKPVTLLDGPESDAIRSAECEATLKNSKAYEATFLHHRKDGTEYISRATVAPLIDPDGSAKFLMLLEMMVSSIEQSALSKKSPYVVPLTLPMALREYPSATMPKHLASHPELDALRDLWTTTCKDRALPQRLDFALAMMQRWASHLSVATVTPVGHFQFRQFGADLTALYGRDLSGCILDDLTPKDLWSVVILHYHEVVGTREPVFAPISIANGHWYTEVSRLLLPLATEDDTVGFVMGADFVRSSP